MGRTIATATLVLLLGTAAYASSVHLKPPNQDPRFTDQGLTLNVAGNLAGLGNGDVLIFLSASAQPTGTCTNPGSGAHQPAGQNPAEVQVTGSQAIPASEIKNGNVSFNVTTNPPVTPVPSAPDCPNSNWIETITDMAFTSAIIRVEQPPGTVVLTVSCTFSAPTTGGAVSDASVTCTPTS